MTIESQNSTTSIRGAALRLILLVSCAHALVHLYELSLPSVEQEVAATYFGDEETAGQKFTGLLNNCWRLAFGFGALLAGWLVDRWGARTMLAVYLFGCGAMCILVGFALEKTFLFMGMFTMGAFASIYHPAGLALISRETNARTRTRALGLHGIFGSIGIGVAPLIAALAMSNNFQATWQQYYWLLAGPGIALGVVFVLRTSRPSETGSQTDGGTQHDVDSTQANQQTKQQLEDEMAEASANWPSYFVLILVAAMQGFVYSAMMTFLARYLTENMGFSVGQDSAAYGKVYAGGVLTLGCVGQYIAGRFAGPKRLEIWMALITAANAPFLIWMAYATGTTCAIAAGLFALIHFMHQPIYNSLIAKYTPARRRSLCYGLSFTMGFGVGSFGAAFAGYCGTFRTTYLSLGGIVVAAAILMCLLVWMNPVQEET